MVFLLNILDGKSYYIIPITNNDLERIKNIKEHLKLDLDNHVSVETRNIKLFGPISKVKESLLRPIMGLGLRDGNYGEWVRSGRTKADQFPNVVKGSPEDVALYTQKFSNNSREFYDKIKPFRNAIGELAVIVGVNRYADPYKEIALNHLYEADHTRVPS